MNYVDLKSHLVALIRDEPELVSLDNAGFDDTSAWTLTGTWFIAAGTLNTNAISSGYAAQPITLIPGERYETQYTVTNFTGSGSDPYVRVQFADELSLGTGAVVGAENAANGTFADSLIAGPNNDHIQFYDNDITCSVDNVSVHRKPLTGTRYEAVQFLQTHVQDRIYDLRRPQASKYPCMVITMDGGELDHNLGTQVNFAKDDLEVMFFAESQYITQQMYEAFRQAFVAYRGLYKGVRVHGMWITGKPFDRREPPIGGRGDGIWSTSITLSVAYDVPTATF